MLINVNRLMLMEFVKPFVICKRYMTIFKYKWCWSSIRLLVLSTYVTLFAINGVLYANTYIYLYYTHLCGWDNITTSLWVFLILSYLSAHMHGKDCSFLFGTCVQLVMIPHVHVVDLHHHFSSWDRWSHAESVTHRDSLPAYNHTNLTRHILTGTLSRHWLSAQLGMGC